ncbi:MAG: MATE family efflux transporter, partial [Proteobacteria bacterium]|nr:MATE family efflux transporter [Pseudomonadota bacterium]
MLTEEKIWSLLLKLSIPAMIGMIVNALYNVVDTIFVGRSVGVRGIAAISIAFPIQMIVMAVSLSIGIGSASIISRRWGAKDIEGAEATLGNALSLTVLLGVIIGVPSVIFAPQILRIFGASKNIIGYSVVYLRIILSGIFFTLFTMVTNNIIRAEGNANMAMITMLTSAIINIILDPIFIFGLHMGVAGAAIATVIAKFITTVVQFYYFSSKFSIIKFHVKKLKLKWHIIKEIFAIGSSAFARQVVGSITIIILNKLLSVYGGDMGIAVYGVIQRLLMLAYMPMFGIAQGLQPIVGFNYGAGLYERVKEVIKDSIIAASLISTLSFVILYLFPAFFISLFSKNVTLIEMGSGALRIITAAFPLIGFQIVASSMYQS